MCAYTIRLSSGEMSRGKSTTYETGTHEGQICEGGIRDRSGLLSDPQPDVRPTRKPSTRTAYGQRITPSRPTGDPLIATAAHCCRLDLSPLLTLCQLRILSQRGFRLPLRVYDSVHIRLSVQRRTGGLHASVRRPITVPLCISTTGQKLASELRTRPRVLVLEKHVRLPPRLLLHFLRPLPHVVLAVLDAAQP
jgi:hypothetical protein